MALIKLTAFMDNISGKLNGTVFAKNKGGNYVRSKSKPSNPQTDTQMAVRAAFGAISSIWRSLTQVARNAWNEAAPSFPYINRLGDSKVLSGFALHQKLNANLQTVRSPLITFPPEPISPAPLNGVTILMENAGGSLDFEATGSFAGDPVAETSVLIFATPVLSAGITNYDNRLRLIGVSTGTELEGGYNFHTDYEDVFGTPAVGSTIGLRFQPVHNVTGVAGAPWYSKGVVVG